jgi:ankyrin repeat protein
VELGADKEAADAEGSTPLHVAAHQGHVPVVKTLIELGADKEASTAEGSTPLHVAAWRGHVEVVKTLVELKADIGALTNSGETPLQLSIRYGHPSCGAGAEGGDGARTFCPYQKGGGGQEAHAAGHRPRGAHAWGHC